jgi:AbrB family looped-hinge helix DNA binding protein
MAKVKVTRNYQVTIPEEVRKTVHLKEGDSVEISALDSERALLRRTIPLEELEGAWKDDKDIEKAMKEVKTLWKSWKIKHQSA